MSWSVPELDARIEEIIVDAYGDDEQLGSFVCVLDEPADATTMGEAVQLLAVENGGNHLGIRTRVRRSGRSWVVTAVDVAVDPSSHPELAVTLAAYRRWLGVES